MLPLDTLLDALADRVAERLRPTPPDCVQQRLLTVADAAGYLGRSKAGIHRLISAGHLKAVRADRRVFLDRDDLNAFIARNKH